MKEKIIKSLRNLASGSSNSEGSMKLLAIIVAIIVIAGVLAIPLLLIYGLKLLGFDVDVTWSTYLGSVLIMVYLGFGRPSQSKED